MAEAARFSDAISASCSMSPRLKPDPIDKRELVRLT